MFSSTTKRAATHQLKRVLATRGLQAFASDRRGNVAVTFSLALLPVIGLAGAAVDYSRGSSGTADLQRATDAAALAAVLARAPLASQREAVGRQAFASTNTGPTTDVALSVVATATGATVTATGAVKTTVASVMQVNQMNVSAHSRAEKVYAGPPPCILALNRSAPGAITFAGSSSFSASGCVVHTNSSSGSALTFEGSSGTATAAGFCSVGGVSTSRVITPTPQAYCDPMRDPFESLPHPSSSGCDFTGVSVDPKQTRTLRPGVYCGGLALKGTATLEPGTYVIKDGPLTITSQATVTGRDVSFFLTGANAGFTFDAGSVMNLRAPAGGTRGGILIFQNRASNAGFENKLSGGGDTVMVGAIYTPTQKVTLAGGSGFGQKSPFMPLIADQIRISGSATSQTDMTGITLAAPLPRSLSGARLTH